MNLNYGLGELQFLFSETPPDVTISSQPREEPLARNHRTFDVDLLPRESRARTNMAARPKIGEQADLLTRTSTSINWNMSYEVTTAWAIRNLNARHQSIALHFAV